jgi:hypothetical protein
MLLSTGGMLFALCVVTLGVMFRRCAMGFGGILVMFSCFIVLVLSHFYSPVIVCVVYGNVAPFQLVPQRRLFSFIWRRRGADRQCPKSHRPFLRKSSNERAEGALYREL